MNTIYLSFLLLLINAAAFAKDILVSIKITDEKNIAVAYAKLSLSNQQDSTQTLSAMLDDSGSIVLPVKTGERYFVEVVATGYKNFRSTLIATDTVTQFFFTLKEDQRSLNEVVVKAVKPLMRQEDDKTVIDPQVLVESSTNGYEILEKTPGLFID